MLLASKSTHCWEVRQSQIPSQAITRNLSSLCNSTFFIFGYAGYHLCFDADLLIQFVLEIAQGSGQTQNAAHSAFLDEATGSFDPSHFFRVVRFVILRHLKSSCASCENTSAVAWVGAVNGIFSKKSDTCCAASGLRVGCNRVFGFLTIHLLIHLDESFFECVFVLRTFVFWQLLESFNELFLDVLGDFFASVSIEYAENRFPVG